MKWNKMTDDGIFPSLSSLFYRVKVNSSMSNKMVLYPDHFLGPCVNHLGTQSMEKEKNFHFNLKRKIFMYSYRHENETKQPNYQKLCISKMLDLTKKTQSQIFILKMSLLFTARWAKTEWKPKIWCSTINYVLRLLSLFPFHYFTPGDDIRVEWI